MEQSGAPTEYTSLLNNFISDAFNVLDEQYAFAVLAPAATLATPVIEEPTPMNHCLSTFREDSGFTTLSSPAVATSVITFARGYRTIAVEPSSEEPTSEKVTSPQSPYSEPKDMDLEIPSSPAPTIEIAEVLQHLSPKPTTSRRSRKSKTAVVVPGKWYCGQCDRNFLSKRGLIQHNNSQHTGVKAYRCDTCGKHFDRAEERDRHQKRHVMSSKPHPCTVDGCARRYNTVFDRNRHVEEYHEGAKHGCVLCGKRFARKDHLQGHELAHENDTVKKPRKRVGVKEQEKDDEKAQEE